MQETTRELMKKFEQENEVYISATGSQTHWIVYARVPREPSGETQHLHRVIKFVTGPNEDGNVLVLKDPFTSDAYSAESWGPTGTIDDFIKKAFARILEETAAGTGQGESCGTSCS